MRVPKIFTILGGRTARAYQSWGLLVLRCGAGLSILLQHGYGKLLDGPEKWSRLGELGMGTLGITTFHTFFGVLATLAESVGALLLVLGLLFRPAAALLTATMAIAITYHLVSGKGNPELALVYGTTFLALLLTGPGRYSLDRILFPPE